MRIRYKKAHDDYIDAVARILVDKTYLQIINYLSHQNEPKSTLQISLATGLPRVSMYRHLRELTDMCLTSYKVVKGAGKQDKWERRYSPNVEEANINFGAKEVNGKTLCGIIITLNRRSMGEQTLVRLVDNSLVSLQESPSSTGPAGSR